MSKIKLGVSPLSWMNSDIPSLGSSIPIEQCLAEAAKIGYQGVELEDPMRQILEQLPSILDKLKITCAAGWHSTFLLKNSWQDERDSVSKHLEVLDKIGAKMVNLAECADSVHRQAGVSLLTRPKLDDEKMQRLAESLETLAEFIHGQGFQTAYHHHMGTVVQDADDIRRLMEGTETLGLLFDTGHLYFAGDDPFAVMKEHLSRITHVHLKNIRPQILNKNGDFFSAIVEGAFTVPGDGLGIDFQPIVNALKEKGYRGWMIVEAEQDPGKANPYQYAKLGYDTISSALK